MSRSVVFTQTLTSGQTIATSGINFSQVWQKAVMIIPSCPSGSIQMYSAFSVDGTYYPICKSDSIVTDPFTINSSLVSGGCVVHIPEGVQFFKVRNTSGCTDAVKTFKIICSEDY